MTDMVSDVVKVYITNRQKFGQEIDPHLIGYTTKGGTYMLATNGKQSENGKPNDLLAITGHTGVHIIRATIHPQLVGEVRELLEQNYLDYVELRKKLLG